MHQQGHWQLGKNKTSISLSQLSPFQELLLQQKEQHTATCLYKNLTWLLQNSYFAEEMQKWLFPHSGFKNGWRLPQISPEKCNAYGTLFQSTSETSNYLQVLQFVLLNCPRTRVQSLLWKHYCELTQEPDFSAWEAQQEPLQRSYTKTSKAQGAPESPQ